MMRFDPVHDIQEAYRQLVQLHAFPGSITNFGSLAAVILPTPDFNPVMMLFGLMLVDGEVQFYLSSEDSERDGRSISERTFSRQSDPSAAEFLFITKEAPDSPAIISAATIGTLIDPQLGATVVLEVDRIGDKAPAQERVNGDAHILELSGPGIQATKRIIGSWKQDWLTVRNRKVAEYPLGIDMILIDSLGMATALPRTTGVREIG
jgi:alpha-D-ribose 1-methylphosphonate 5-triphosphate synthase subunit PhnH